MPLWSALNSKEFLSALINNLKTREEQEIQDKILYLIQNRLRGSSPRGCWPSVQVPDPWGDRACPGSVRRPSLPPAGAPWCSRTASGGGLRARRGAFPGSTAAARR